MSGLPAHFTCGNSFTVEHTLSCPKGGLPSIRHNKIRDLTATLLTEVCSQVVVESELATACVQIACTICLLQKDPGNCIERIFGVEYLKDPL